VDVGVAVGFGAACAGVRFTIHRLANNTRISGTLKKILVRRIIGTSYIQVNAISTTPRYRVPDRDMDIGERTPPRANDMESSAGLDSSGTPPS